VDAGYLEGEGMERTWKFSQEALKKELDIGTAKKMFDLRLDDFGPYSIDYTRNGRHLLLGGLKGHIAAFDWQQGKLACELHVRETVRDVTWLHNDTMFAVAQKKYTYIYDKTGMELHTLRHHIEVNRLEFLPYHFLLASVGNAGWLRYQDTSTGKLVAEQRTRLGKCATMAQNPYNAIINLGHANAIAIDNSGKYMATAGLDGQLKIWDIRTYKEIDAYFTTTPAATLSFSAKGLLAAGAGPRVTIWKDLSQQKQKEPYMTHMLPSSSLAQLQFCPFEDVLGLGHKKGFSSMIVPGSGEPNFDTLEANPYQTNKQRQENEVHALLEKIQPEMITLDPTFVGKLDRASADVINEEAKKEWEAKHPHEKYDPKMKARGKSSSQRRYLRKQTNIVDEKRLELKEQLEKAQKESTEAKKKAAEEREKEPRTALDRFKVF
ncbi:Small subunit (SSU) processome component, partial [Kappamyces sp. JEL0680]